MTSAETFYRTIAVNGSSRLSDLLNQRSRLQELIVEILDNWPDEKADARLQRRGLRRLLRIEGGLDRQVEIARTMTMTCSFALGLGGDRDGHSETIAGPDS